MKIEVATNQFVEIECANAVGYISLEEFREILYTALQSEEVVNMTFDHPRFNRPPPLKVAV